MRSVSVAILFLLILFFGGRLSAQHFSGTKGSVYSPVINTASQPAAGAAMPYSWSVEIAGINTFWSNNIIALSPAIFDWHADSIFLNPYFVKGSAKRRGAVGADLHLLNFLFHIPGHEKWVVGAGWNMRSRVFASQLNYDYQDSMATFSHFLIANAMEKPQRGLLLNQQWMEAFINVSTVLQENEFEKISVGGSLKFIKGISAEVIDIKGLQLGVFPKDAPEYFAISRLAGRYGYSANLEELENDNSASERLRTLSAGSRLSLGLDLGFTYTRKRPVLIAGFPDREASDYQWKVSVALTDIGRLRYPLGTESRVANGIKNQPDVDYLQYIVERAPSLAALNDSLSKIAQISPWEGTFSMSLPTTLQVGFDKNFGDHFYLHSHLVLDASLLIPGVDYRMHNFNHLMVTPRWEIKRVGLYAPLYLNDRGTFLAGAAIRIGPLTAGLHDFRWLFDHTKSGGGYVALTIKKFFKEDEECPSF